MAGKSDRIKRKWIFRGLGFTLVLMGCILRVSDPYPVEMSRLIYFDFLQRLAPRTFDADLPVRVVDIDEASLSQLGQWPWPRSIVARLVEKLDDYGAASIAFDMLFAEPDRYSPHRLAEDPAFAGLLRDAIDLSELDNDQRFSNAIAGRPVALGVAARPDLKAEQILPRAGIIEIGDQPGLLLPRALSWTPLAMPLNETAVGIGGINVSPAGQISVVRTVPLLWQGPTGIIPSLSIEALRLTIAEQNIFVEGAKNESGIVLSVSLGAFDIPTDEIGQIWMHYRPDNPGLYLSAADVLDEQENERLRSEIEGRIILIGTSAAGLTDIRETSLGQSVPGVSIHAQLIEQVLENKMLRRSDRIAALELVAFIALGAIVVSVMSIAGAVPSFFAGGVAASSVLVLSWIAFTQNSVLFDATFPLAGGMVNFGILAGFQLFATEREKNMIRRSFSHYVAPEILEQLEESGQELQLGGETQEITVMFADIRGFTPLSETMPATDLVALLNELFTALGQDILAHSGTIDKYIGDSIMAFWNAPVRVENHPLHCANAALAMRRSLRKFNAGRSKGHKIPIGIAIGCATGQACVGNIGSKSRFNYTAIGDVVNITSRIETACRHLAYDIVISESVAHASGDQLALLQGGSVALKGVNRLELLFLVVGDRKTRQSESFQTLQSHHSDLVAAMVGRHAAGKFAEKVEQCRSIAIEIEPGLAGFYDRISDRIRDFQVDGHCQSKIG